MSHTLAHFLLKPCYFSFKEALYVLRIYNKTNPCEVSANISNTNTYGKRHSFCFEFVHIFWWNKARRGEIQIYQKLYSRNLFNNFYFHYGNTAATWKIILEFCKTLGDTIFRNTNFLASNWTPLNPSRLPRYWKFQFSLFQLLLNVALFIFTPIFTFPYLIRKYCFFKILKIQIFSWNILLNVPTPISSKIIMCLIKSVPPKTNRKKKLQSISFQYTITDLKTIYVEDKSK